MVIHQFFGNPTFTVKPLIFNKLTHFYQIIELNCRNKQKLDYQNRVQILMDYQLIFQLLSLVYQSQKLDYQNQKLDYQNRLMDYQRCFCDFHWWFWCPKFDFQVGAKTKTQRAKFKRWTWACWLTWLFFGGLLSNLILRHLDS